MSLGASRVSKRLALDFSLNLDLSLTIPTFWDSSLHTVDAGGGQRPWFKIPACFCSCLLTEKSIGAQKDGKADAVIDLGTIFHEAMFAQDFLLTSALNRVSKES